MTALPTTNPRDRLSTQENETPQKPAKPEPKQADATPNWNRKCTVCRSVPTVGKLGLCGPCCFGDASTAGGNW